MQHPGAMHLNQVLSLPKKSFLFHVKPQSVKTDLELVYTDTERKLDSRVFLKWVSYTMLNIHPERIKVGMVNMAFWVFFII